MAALIAFTMIYYVFPITGEKDSLSDYYLDESYSFVGTINETDIQWIWGNGSLNDTQWHHNGYFHLETDIGIIEIWIKADTDFRTDNMVPLINASTGEYNYSYHRDDLVRVRGFVREDYQNERYVEAREVSRIEEIPEEKENMPLGSLMGILLPFIMVGLLFILLEYRRIGLHRKNYSSNRAAMPAKPVEEPLKVLHRSELGELTWYDNSNPFKKKRKNVWTLLLIMVSVATTGLILFLLLDSYVLLLTPMIPVITLIPITLVYYSEVRQTPLRIGISKKGVVVEYRKKVPDSYLENKCWSDVSWITFHWGGKGATLDLRDGNISYLLAVDPSITHELKIAYLNYQRKRKDDESVDIRSETRVKASGRFKLITDKTDSIIWARQGIGSLIKLAASLIFVISSFCMILPITTINWEFSEVHYISGMIFLFGLAIFVVGLWLIIAHDRLQGISWIGVSNEALHFRKVGENARFIPERIPFRNIVRILEKGGGIEIRLHNGLKIINDNISKQDTEWITKAFHRYQREHSGRLPTPVTNEPERWLENSLRRKFRTRGVIPCIVILSLMIFVSVSIPFILYPILASYVHIVLVPSMNVFVMIALIVTIDSFGYFIIVIMFNDNFKNYRKAPVSVASTSQGMFVKWPKQKGASGKKDDRLERISWNDVKDVTDKLKPETLVPGGRSRTLTALDEWGKEYTISHIDDSCADAIMEKWNIWNDRISLPE